MDGDGTPHALLATRFNEFNSSVSIDGRWIAYLSDESGQTEAYVQSYPVPGGKYQVTTGGATFVVWRQDGKHLSYGLRTDPGHGRVAEIRADSEFRLGPSEVVVTFPKESRALLADHPFTRLIALFPVGKDPTPSITVVLDGLRGPSGR